MRRGRLGSLIRRASMRRGPTEFLRLSLTRDTSGAGRRPRFVLSRENPQQGEGGTGRLSQDATAPTGRLGRRDGRDAHSKGGPQGLLSFCRSAPGIGWEHEGSGEAEEARQEGPAEDAEGEAQREEGQEA